MFDIHTEKRQKITRTILNILLVCIEFFLVLLFVVLLFGELMFGHGKGEGFGIGFFLTFIIAFTVARTSHVYLLKNRSDDPSRVSRGTRLASYVVGTFLVVVFLSILFMWYMLH